MLFQIVFERCSNGFFNIYVLFQTVFKHLMLSDSTILLSKLFQSRIILTKKGYLYEFTLAIFT
jgi:hypothetical protein